MEAATDVGIVVRAPQPGIRYVSFIDASGGRGDSFTAAIAHAEGQTAVLDCLIEIRSPFDPDVATRDISIVLKCYGLSKTTADHYAAGWIVSAFARNGVKLEHSERNRSEIYLDALAAVHLWSRQADRQPASGCAVLRAGAPHVPQWPGQGESSTRRPRRLLQRSGRCTGSRGEQEAHGHQQRTTAARVNADTAERARSPASNRSTRASITVTDEGFFLKTQKGATTIQLVRMAIIRFWTIADKVGF